MNRHIRTLSVLLALQLLLLAGILVWQQRTTTTGNGALLPIDRSRVDRVVIVDDKGQTLKLERGDNGWMLPDVRGLPADADKIGALLDKLIAANAPWPIATSAESAKRFEVATDKFQREIKLLDKEQVLADVYLGTSPGFKKVHARRAGSDDVYAIDFANYDATARGDDWLAKSLLQPNGDIATLTRPDHWTVQHTGDAWTVEGLKPGETTKQDAVIDLVNKVANLRVMGVAEAPAEGAVPALTLTASTGKGEFDYQLYQAAPKSDFVVARSGQDGYFKLAAYVGEPLVKDRADLINGPAPAAPTVAPPATVPLKKP